MLSVFGCGEFAVLLIVNTVSSELLVNLMGLLELTTLLQEEDWEIG
jgi:hypothetical protein